MDSSTKYLLTLYQHQISYRYTGKTRKYMHEIKEIYWTPSTKAVSSKVCNQLKIIIFLSYFDNGLPRSLSTSRMVRGKFLLALCCTTLRTAALVLLGAGTAFGIGLEPGTVRSDVPEFMALDWHSVFTLAAAVEGATSSLSKLNSLCDNRSNALYVVSSLRRI